MVIRGWKVARITTKGGFIIDWDKKRQISICLIKGRLEDT
jgi:hypothetical protein